MLVRIFTLIMALSFQFVVQLGAQDAALQNISKKDLKKHLTYLASDDLMGRRLGTDVDGLGMAADYLAEYARQTSLLPGNQSYFQHVDIVKTTPIEDGWIEIRRKETSIFRDGSCILLKGTPGIYEFDNEEFVFVGFGNNEINESDIEGKIVVCSQGSKELFTDWKWEQTGWSNYSESKKFSKLAALAPKAIIMVLLPNDKAERSYKNIERWMNRERYTLKTLGDEKQVPVLLAPASFGEMFVNKSSSYRKALKKYATTGSLHHFRTHEQRLNLRIGTNFEHTNAQNVMGWIEGSDPLLKDEYVVFVAHYDHLGVASDGDVYNGADDNGSGTVAIMEVAKAFSQLEVKPKRSIVFLWVTCEEIGHLGSTYYSDNPVFPLEKTVAAINLDMVGRVYDGPRDDVWEKSPKKVKDFNGLYTLSNDIWPELAKINQEKCKQLGLVPDTSLPKERFLRSSDHYHFHKKGVPILNYATGYHADYHKPGDEVDKINFDKIKRVADLCFLVGYEIANLDSINF